MTATRRAGDLGDSQIGRTVTAAGLTGVLVGLLPVRDEVVLALVVGRARCWTDALPADTPVEIHPKQPVEESVR